ncbi:bacterial low temperature requirement A protein-domain-containing protein [Parasitella parasitica]|nr:bacterial low temperature requirement A protein-domain-containing protein [Parasitella parasitica]
MAQNRGYQAPAFGYRGAGGRQRQSLRTDDEEAGHTSNRSNLSVTSERHPATAYRRPSHSSRYISNESSISNGSGAVGSNVIRIRTNEHETVAPLHDPAGKPLRRHGTETIGDVLLHPLKEFQLHQKRSEAYQTEKIAWNEKHPDSIASEKDVNIITDEMVDENVRVRLTIHFRHLVGDQDFEINEDQISELEKPLQLSPAEKEQFKTFKDTDDLIDFLERTHRDFSVKVHKTVQMRAQLASAKGDLFQDSSKSSFDLSEKTNAVLSDKTNTSSSTEKLPTVDEKHNSGTFKKSDSGELSQATKKHPHKNHSPSDLLMDLNENVYIQVQFILIVQRNHHNVRRDFFSVPDPDLSDEIGEESSATWVELLGDVFYVGWLSQFTHSVHINSVATLNTYAAWFVVMWWTWCSSALYSSRYDRQDVAHHLYKIIELCGLILMAGSSDKQKFESEPKWFIIGYIIMKAVVLFEYSVVFIVSLSAHFKSSRRPLGVYVAASAISIAMWGVSLLYQSQADMAKRYALWYVSIGMEIIVHMILQGNSRVSLAASHLGERFGLFTLIILGENCMGFIKMVTESNFTSSVIACNVFGVTIIFCYFFMYFDDFSGELMNQTKLSQLWMYLHFPLHLFQVAFGIALTEIISSHNNGVDNAASFYHTLQTCAAAAASHGTSAAAEQSITNTTAAEHAVTSTTNSSAVNAHYAMLALAAEATTSSAESGHETVCDDPLFSIKIFWITAGLILCFNAFIKLVNTPVNRGSLKSYIICASRILNAIIFFALSTTTYANLNGLAMVSIMMACLLFQSGVDLLD